MSSLGYRTSFRGLDEVPELSKRQAQGYISKDPDRRAFKRMMMREKITRMREAEQLEHGISELPFELINQSSGEVLKKHFMTDSDAKRRNTSIRELGLAWRRCGY